MNKKKLLACLNMLGIEPTMESFDDRKKIQKISYWLPIFGIDVGLSKDSYSWYLHGPYSPQLTDALYEIVGKVKEASLSTLTTKEMAQINVIKRFLGKDIDSSDSLELLVSLHYILQEAKRSGIDTSVALNVLKEKKPYFKENEIQKALQKLRMLS